MKISQKPARILHRNQKYIPPGAAMPKLAQDACAVMRLPKSAARLMVYYATCENGFSPALQTIRKATGIDRTNISGIRKLLVNVGLIRYTPGTTGTIRIDWKRIATMAALPPEVFDGVRRSMAERLKAEQFAPAFKRIQNPFGNSDSSRTPKLFYYQKRYDKRRNPLALDENPESNFCFGKASRCFITKRREKAKTIYERFGGVENWKLRPKAKFYQLLIAGRIGEPAGYVTSENLYKVSNKNFEGVEENENHAEV